MPNAVRRTSIVDSFHEPALRLQVLVNAIQRGFLFTFPTSFRLNFRSQRPHLDVPFIAGPRGLGPLVAFGSPRTGERQDSPARPIATEKRRLSFLKLNRSRKWSPVYSHRRSCLFFRDRTLFLHFRQNKPLLLKRVGAMRVEQHGRTDPTLPHRVLYSREGDFKTLRIGSERQQQPDSPESPRHIGDSQTSSRRIPAGHRSQSEADWAYAKRALARGDDPEVGIHRIADFRSEDESDPVYCARLTVTKARAHLHGLEGDTTFHQSVAAEMSRTQR